MIAALRDFLDAVAAAKPDEVTTGALASDLLHWTERLSGFAVPEVEQPFAHRPDLPGRGQVMFPGVVIDAVSPNELRGHVVYGRYFLGGNGAVHGGAVQLLMDEVLGRLANTGRPRARTGYIKVDFRSITPIDEPLNVHAWVVSEEGRKRFLRGEIRRGDTLCAEAEGLFIQLLPGQP